MSYIIFKLPFIFRSVAYSFNSFSFFSAFGPLSIIRIIWSWVTSFAVVQILIIVSFISAFLLVVYVLALALEFVIDEVSLIAEFVRDVVLSVSLFDSSN